MGSGKTTAGKKIAAILQLPFADLDLEIENSQQKSIAQIFNDEGEVYFRKIEKNELKKLAARTAPAVISLGGGTVCNEENLSLIKSRGLLIYLNLPVNALISRLGGNLRTRPLLAHLDESSLEQFVSEKLEERKKYYESADIIVNGLNLVPRELCRTIIDQNSRHTNNT